MPQVTHVADGLPLPLRIATKIWVRFLESLYPCEHEMSIKKLFYHPVSELPAKSYSQFSPLRLDWPYCLGGNSETGWWKFFFMLVSCSYGYRLSKKCTLIFVAIRKGRGSPSATCASWPYFFSKEQLYNAVVGTSVLTKPVLCTNWPKFTMIFYYLKYSAHSSPQSSDLSLTGALKWGTLRTSISIGKETKKGKT